MTTFVYRAFPMWTVPAAGGPKPYAASVTFYPDDGMAEIAVPRDGGGVPHSVQFSRGLLIDGLAEPVGEGDVRVGPHPDMDDWLLIELPIEGRQVEFWAERAPIDEFVDATLLLVPSSREAAELDVESVIARILEEASS